MNKKNKTIGVALAVTCAWATIASANITASSFNYLGSDIALTPLDLTQEGALDWVMLGGQAVGSRDEKNSANYISTINVVGSLGRNTGSAYQSSWTDGAPNATGTDVQGNWEAGTGEPLSFSVSGLDAGEYALTIYAGAYRSTANLVATNGVDTALLAFDQSSADRASHYGVFTINFDVQSAADVLDVVYAKTGGAGGGNVNVSAMTLAAIPEPATLGLVAAFGGGLLFIRRRFLI